MFFVIFLKYQNSNSDKWYLSYITLCANDNNMSMEMSWLFYMELDNLKINTRDLLLFICQYIKQIEKMV